MSVPCSERVAPLSRRLYDAVVVFLWEDWLCWTAPLTVLLWLFLSWIDRNVFTAWNLSVQSRAFIVHGVTFVWSWLLVALFHFLNSCKWAQKFRIVSHEDAGIALEAGNEPSHELQAGQLYRVSPSETKRLPLHVERLTFFDIAPNCLRNQAIYFVSSFLGCGLFSNKLALFWNPDWDTNMTCPTLTRMLIEMATLLIVFDVVAGMFHCHLLHGVLYKYHKEHHQTKGDSPLSGWYMDFVDFIFQLWIPVIIAPLLLGVSWMTFFAWLLLVEFDGVRSHAGYDLGWPVPSSQRHFLHHALSTCNYSNGLYDALLGTEATRLDGLHMNHARKEQFQAGDAIEKINPKESSAFEVRPTLLSV